MDVDMMTPADMTYWHAVGIEYHKKRKQAEGKA